jgi:hypothetical protein
VLKNHYRLKNNYLSLPNSFRKLKNPTISTKNFLFNLITFNEVYCYILFIVGDVYITLGTVHLSGISGYVTVVNRNNLLLPDSVYEYRNRDHHLYTHLLSHIQGIFELLNYREEGHF